MRRYGRERWGHKGEGAGTASEVENELGDIFFLAARIADMCGVSLSRSAEKAIAKFQARLQQNNGGGGE